MTHIQNMQTKFLVTLMIAALILLAFLSLNTLPTHGQEEAVLTFAADKDTSVDETERNQTHGSALTVVVRSGPSTNARALFGFPFEQIPPGSVVINATLTVYINQSAYSLRKYVASRLDHPWEENETTWDNQPWWGQECDRKAVVPVMNAVTFDVTTVLRQYS